MSKVDIDRAIDLIIEGKTVREIAAEFDTSLSNLYKHFDKEEHSARVREALHLSATVIADKAEEVLIAAKSNIVEITRARELSQYYRWKASKRAPKTFGDKLDIDHTTGGEKIKPTIILENTNAINDRYGFNSALEAGSEASDGV